MPPIAEDRPGRRAPASVSHLLSWFQLSHIRDPNTQKRPFARKGRFVSVQTARLDQWQRIPYNGWFPVKAGKIILPPKEANMSRLARLLLTLSIAASCLLPSLAPAQIYGAQGDSADIYCFVDTARITVNPIAQIPPSRESLTIARDWGCDILVAGRDTGDDRACVYRLNPATQTLAVIDTLDQYDEPAALCRGPGLDMYIMLDSWQPKAGGGARGATDPYIGRLQDGLPPVDTIRIFNDADFDLVDMQVWRYGDHAGHVATLERRNDGENHWWDIGEYEMTPDDTLFRIGWRFDDTAFQAGPYTMRSIAIMPSGHILMASTDSLYLVDDAGDWTTFGDDLGAADLEVGADRIVYALDGASIRRYDESGARILPDLTAPNAMGDLAVGDYVFTPEGENVLVEPAPNIEITYEEGTQEGQTSAVVETTSARVSPGGNYLPAYAAVPGTRSGPFTYVSLGTDAVYNSLIQVDVLLEGSRLFYASGVGDTFRDFTVVGSIEDARGTIPRFDALPCPGGEEGRPVTDPAEVVLIEDTRTLPEVTVYKFWRLERAMVVSDTVPPCPWGVIHGLQDRVAAARGRYDIGQYGNALSELVLMNYELRDLAGWCVPDSSDAPLGNRVGRILSHSKTLMYSIEREWEHEDPSGIDEGGSTVSLAVTTPARGECRMAVHGPAGAEATVIIYDVAGRLVSTVYEGPLVEGGTVVVWDGADSSGNRVGSGVYFARAEADGRSATSKLVFIR